MSSKHTMEFPVQPSLVCKVNTDNFHVKFTDISETSDMSSGRFKVQHTGITKVDPNCSTLRIKLEFRLSESCLMTITQDQ